MYPSLLKRPIGYYCFLAVAALGIFVSTGFAADETITNPEVITGFLDQISKHFQVRAGEWEEVFRLAAKRVFRVLLVIDFVYVSFDILFLKGEDIRTWAGEILRQVLIIGFFSWVLFNSNDAVSVILQGLSDLAGKAISNQGGSLADISSPSKILDEGVKNANLLMLAMAGAKSGGWWAPVKAFFAEAASMGFYGVFIMMLHSCIILIYAMIACRLLITQIEVYISLSCGVVVLAFGGSRWTREPAIRYCWFLMALALKIFTIYIMISLGNTIIHDIFINAEDKGLLSNITAWFMMIGCLAIWLVILWVIPNSVAQLVSHIGGVGGGGAAGASAAAGLIGGSLAYAGSAVSTAVKTAGVAAAPATGGAGLAVSAAIAAGEKAMQAGVGLGSSIASQAGGAGQGGSGGKSSLGGIASKVGPGSTSSAISSGQSQIASKSSSSLSGNSGAAGSMATSAATTALGGIAKGITGTVSGAASLGANGTLDGTRTANVNAGISPAQRQDLEKKSPKPPAK